MCLFGHAPPIYSFSGAGNGAGRNRCPRRSVSLKSSERGIGRPHCKMRLLSMLPRPILAGGWGAFAKPW